MVGGNTLKENGHFFDFKTESWPEIKIQHRTEGSDGKKRKYWCKNGLQEEVIGASSTRNCIFVSVQKWMRNFSFKKSDYYRGVGNLAADHDLFDSFFPFDSWCPKSKSRRDVQAICLGQQYPGGAIIVVIIYTGR